ncbi:MAG: hypothetical protein KAS12_03790, partial [Candidatus Aenigmarchaeota archaeon]|nr:hypothetical protein [Candidatus Aenigmarchaeota archaeon]
MMHQLKARKKESLSIKDKWNKKAKEFLDALLFKTKELTSKEIKEKKQKQHENELKILRRAKLFYSYFPKKYRQTIECESRYAGFMEVPAKYIYYISMIFIVVSILNTSYLLLFFNVPIWMVLIPPTIILFMAFTAPYILFTMLAESRRKRMELVLPDILMLASA